MEELVMINGAISKPSEAKISVFDRGFLYGDATYEVVRSYSGKLFAVEPHIDRLFLSAERISMKLPYTKKQYLDRMQEFYQKAPFDDAYLRIQISRGEGPITLDPYAPTTVNEVMYLRPLKPHPREYFERGVPVVIAGVLRNSKKAMDPDIKSGNYLNNVLAYKFAAEKKAHEAIMENSEGFITEATTSNVFCVVNGELWTSPDDSDILRGITRNIVITLAQGLDIPLKKKNFTRQDLKNADEAFLTSSTREVMPIASVNGDVLKSSPGPVTRRLQQAYYDYVKNA